eukprot:m.38915 g.38915  ORF g.38915 m.38915 type:complete len:353 (+) comp32642_c0_seq1:30-1088(+)
MYMYKYKRDDQATVCANDVMGVRLWSRRGFFAFFFLLSSLLFVAFFVRSKIRSESRLNRRSKTATAFYRANATVIPIRSSTTEALDSQCEAWLSRKTAKAPYFLTSVILLRIHKKSKSKLTSRELRQWLLYQHYMGVEHVYLYDAFVTDDESQKANVTKFIDDEFVTYVDWHTHNPYTIQGTQVAAYQHCIDHFGKETTWQTAIDIDEYPFSPVDREPGFLERYVRRFGEKHPDASEICMQNYLFLGKPLWEREMLIDRMWRRTPKRSNRLVKPTYKPANVHAQVHHNYVQKGYSMDAPDNQLRLNHYWGARLQNWGDDTPEILNQTIVDKGMEYIVSRFHRCEKQARFYLS